MNNDKSLKAILEKLAHDIQDTSQRKLVQQNIFKKLNPVIFPDNLLSPDHNKDLDGYVRLVQHYSKPECKGVFVYLASPLHIAALLGRTHLIEILLHTSFWASESLILNDSEGNSPLAASIFSANAETVAVILRRFILSQPDVNDVHLEVAISTAISVPHGSEEILNIFFSRNSENEGRLNYNKLLMMAISAGNLQAASFFINNGASVNGTINSSHGLGPLHLAASLGGDNLVPIVKFLLDRGADPNKLVFRDSYADVNDVYALKGTPLHFAIGSQNVSNSLGIIKVFLDGGVDPNILDNYQQTPLFWLQSGIGREKIVKCLVEAGASVNARHCMGETLLISLMWKEFRKSDDDVLGLANVYLEMGVPINAQTQHGTCVLHYASSPGRLWFLLNKGANPYLQNLSGTTPLWFLLSHPMRPDGTKTVDTNHVMVLMYLRVGGCTLAARGTNFLNFQVLRHADTTIMTMLCASGFFTRNCIQRGLKNQPPSLHLPLSLKLFLDKTVAECPTLQSLCRQKIYAVIGYNTDRQAVISKLILPEFMKKYLLFEDMIELVAQANNCSFETIERFFQ